MIYFTIVVSDVQLHFQAYNVKSISVKIVAKIMERVQSAGMNFIAGKYRNESVKGSTMLMIHLESSCRDGFYGEQCELDPCQAMFCENNGKCLTEKNRTICR